MILAIEIEDVTPEQLRAANRLLDTTFARLVVSPAGPVFRVIEMIGVAESVAGAYDITPIEDL